MPIQPEQKIYPHLVVPPPAKEEEIFQWAQNLSRAYEEFTRQVFDKFNGHVAQTHAHFNSWATWRLKRPSYKYLASDQISIEASATKPQYFNMGADLFESTSDLVLDIDASGPGGLRTGLTKAADTVYYLYAVNNGGVASLIADTIAPSTGLTGYSDWTYIGAFMTNASQNIHAFRAMDGRYKSQTRLDLVSHTGNTSFTSKTIVGPTTAKFSVGALELSGTVLGQTGTIMGINDSSNADLYQLNQVSGTENRIELEVPLASSNTVYLKTLNASNTVRWFVHGWIESPEEFQ